MYVLATPPDTADACAEIKIINLNDSLVNGINHCLQIDKDPELQCVPDYKYCTLYSRRDSSLPVRYA